MSLRTDLFDSANTSRPPTMFADGEQRILKIKGSWHPVWRTLNWRTCQVGAGLSYSEFRVHWSTDEDVTLYARLLMNHVYVSVCVCVGVAAYVML